MQQEMIRWLRMPLQDGQTPEDELRLLFLDMEQALMTKGLLRTDFKKYKTLHFSRFCEDVFRHSDFSTH